MSDELTQLRQTGLIAPEVLDQIEQDLKQGGSLITRLQEQLKGDLSHVWAELARRLQRPFYTQPSAVDYLDGRLLTLDESLDYLVLPHRIEYVTAYLLSPDPFARVADYRALKPQLAKYSWGQHVVNIRLELTTPAVFRELFSLLYPYASSTYKEYRDALPMAALLPRRIKAHLKPTPEERTDAIASVLGLEYIDPELLPPMSGSLGDHPPEPFQQKRFYPHHRDTTGKLVLLVSLRNETEWPGVQAALQHLSDVLGDEFRAALVSPRRLQQLLTTVPLTGGDYASV